MTEGEKTLSAAGKLLRKHAKDPEDTAALVIASAVFTSVVNRLPKVEGQSLDDRFAQAMLDAATVLSPVCPHCGKELRAQVSEDAPR